MKKFLRSITNVSLYQQLGIIIVTFAFIFIFFFTVYLKGNIDDFVNRQVMNLLQMLTEYLKHQEESVIIHFLQGGFLFRLDIRESAQHGLYIFLSPDAAVHIVLRDLHHDP